MMISLNSFKTHIGLDNTFNNMGVGVSGNKKHHSVNHKRSFLSKNGCQSIKSMMVAVSLLLVSMVMERASAALNVLPDVGANSGSGWGGTVTNGEGAEKNALQGVMPVSQNEDALNSHGKTGGITDWGGEISLYSSSVRTVEANGGTQKDLTKDKMAKFHGGAGMKNKPGLQKVDDKNEMVYSTDKRVKEHDNKDNNEGGGTKSSEGKMISSNGNQEQYEEKKKKNSLPTAKNDLHLLNVHQVNGGKLYKKAIRERRIGHPGNLELNLTESFNGEQRMLNLFSQVSIRNDMAIMVVTCYKFACLLYSPVI